MHKNAQKLSEKLRAKFPVACLDDAFLEILNCKASPVDRQSLQQKEKKRRKKKGEKKLKNRKA